MIHISVSSAFSFPSCGRNSQTTDYEHSTPLHVREGTCLPGSSRLAPLCTGQPPSLDDLSSAQLRVLDSLGTVEEVYNTNK